MMVDEAKGNGRNRLLETVQAYGRERLEASGEAATIRRRHAEYYRALAEAAAPEFTGPGQLTASARLEREHANLRAALTWSLSAAAPIELGLRLAGALAWFWYTLGYLSEARGWLDAVLTRGVAASAELQSWCLTMAGLFAWRQGDLATARGRSEAARVLGQTLGQRSIVAWSLNTLGLIAMNEGDLSATQALLEESLTVFQS
ncbi:MAG: hypothetical protein ACR2PL_22035, partial [Dehalococcoidia bacterium]